MRYLYLSIITIAAFPACAHAQSNSLRALSKCNHLSEYSLVQEIDSIGFTFNNIHSKVSPQIQRLNSVSDGGAKNNGCESAKALIEKYYLTGLSYREKAAKAIPALQRIGEVDCSGEMTQDSQDIVTSDTNLRANFNRACAGKGN